MNRIPFASLVIAILVASQTNPLLGGDLRPARLRCEYLENPAGIDAKVPRLSWQLRSEQRDQKQAAYRITVASSAEALSRGKADLWDSGKIDSDESLFIEYKGKPLRSRQKCYWQVQVWEKDSPAPTNSEVASWSMGLLQDSDWQAKYISYRDQTEVFADTESLKLPAARQYRRVFASSKNVKKATVYATALGIYELHINGTRVGDAYFAPGWTDYRQRAYYQTYDVTDMVKTGDNAIGAWVAEGWYSGYVGFGLLTGMSTNKTGRSVYGKTPSLMAQLEIEYDDGTREVIGTDTTWKVTSDGPIQAADLLMGEEYDARNELDGWASPGFDDSLWEEAIAAGGNGQPMADFFQFQNPEAKGSVRKVSTKRNLGFRRPKLEAFPGVPVRVIEELPAKTISQLNDDTFIFDLGQNFAGVIRLKVEGKAGQRIRIRYGEMLHPDGRLMTENLRKARATDYYTCKGDSKGEVYQPRFTFHGFRFVEVQGVTSKPALSDVTGLVIHSDTPMASKFECSDPMVNQLFKNVVWTQRANFLDLPTDCPQRDERMGWTGDAQAYVGTAAYNADIGAFYTKWLRELMESQRPSGAFPGYAPYPFQHGWDFGSAWADAGVICPWTIWQAYADTRVINDCWEPMTKFMEWRKSTSVNDLGISHGNAWGDWLAQGETTPLEYVDTIYYAISAKMMSEMASGTGRDEEAAKYRKQFEATRKAFQQKYLQADGGIRVRTQTAQALALFADLIPAEQRSDTAQYLADMLAENGNHMATGFLGTRPLLPVLSAAGQHDLAVFLLQSREFPSWGYEIQNGATTIWERWDSYTKEDAFGRHNAAMNSFSHYAFGAVCEWMFHSLAGIQSEGPGYKRIKICPQPPSPGSNAIDEAIHRVSASYDSIRGTIRSEWQLDDGIFQLNVEIPANTTARVFLPTNDVSKITESGKAIDSKSLVRVVGQQGHHVELEVPSGGYQFRAPSSLSKSRAPLRTSVPKDRSINPDKLDVSTATLVWRWDFQSADDRKAWAHRSGLRIDVREKGAFLVPTANDSQMATKLDSPAEGTLVVELRGAPETGANAQFFWATPGGGFNGRQQVKRTLRKSEKTNAYLWSLDMTTPIDQLRFDPFETFDPYAKPNEFRLESISIYRLPVGEGEPAN